MNKYRKSHGINMADAINYNISGRQEDVVRLGKITSH
jgi:hypothetical protein